jgi:hypothetical protein
MKLNQRGEAAAIIVVTVWVLFMFGHALHTAQTKLNGNMAVDAAQKVALETPAPESPAAEDDKDIPISKLVGYLATTTRFP